MKILNKITTVFEKESPNKCVNPFNLWNLLYVIDPFDEDSTLPSQTLSGYFS